MARESTGPSISTERNGHLQNLVRSGTEIKANITRELLISIFRRDSPLHEGAAIVGNNQILSAGCYIPNLSDRMQLSKEYGSRHRAGLGISEQCDAAVIIVSEETGKVSLAHDSDFSPALSNDQLTEKLYQIFQRPGSEGEASVPTPHPAKS